MLRVGSDFNKDKSDYSLAAQISIRTNLVTVVPKSIATRLISAAGHDSPAPILLVIMLATWEPDLPISVC